MKKSRILISLLPVLFVSCNPGEQEEQNQKKPNVLFIAIDDLKPVLGCYGDSSVVSPNMDKLAGQGSVFMNNHCQQALCGPSRASLMTGKYPDEIRIRKNSSMLIKLLYPILMPR